ASTLFCARPRCWSARRRGRTGPPRSTPVIPSRFARCRQHGQRHLTHPAWLDSCPARGTLASPRQVYRGGWSVHSGSRVTTSEYLRPEEKTFVSRKLIGVITLRRARLPGIRTS